MRGVIIISMLVFVLLSSSCGKIQTTSIGGIDLEILTNQPPEVLRENQYFTVALKLKNNIPRTIYDVNVCISDVLGSEYGGINSEECQSLAIGGAEHDGQNIIPEEAYVSFPEGGNNYVYHNLQYGVDETVIFADIIYPLVTKSEFDICLKRDPALSIEEFSCEANMMYRKDEIDSEFAPISVESVESSIVPEGSQNRIYLDILLKKSRIGDVVFPGDHTKNLMSIRVSLAGKGTYFICESDENGKIKFDKDTKQISCEGTVVLTEAYQMDSINIDLDYTYKVRATIGPIPFEESLEGLV